MPGPKRLKNQLFVVINVVLVLSSRGHFATLHFSSQKLVSETNLEKATCSER